MSYVILDRDGVINFESEQYIKRPEEWIPIPGSLEAIASLNRSGFRVLVATNQSGLARGYFDLDTLSAIHEKMVTALSAVGGYIDEIFYCPHHPEDQCACRKPLPGLLTQIEQKYPVKFNHTFFIGDSYTDIQAARAMGCQPILVLTGKGEKTLATHPDLHHIPYFPSLVQAADYVISMQTTNHV